MPNTPKRWVVVSSSSILSGISIQPAIAMNEMPITQRNTSGPSALAIQPPTKPAVAWLSNVAMRMPRMIGTGLRNLTASSIASNWVLSPISPSATTPVEMRKASKG